MNTEAEKTLLNPILTPDPDSNDSTGAPGWLREGLEFWKAADLGSGAGADYVKAAQAARFKRYPEAMDLLLALIANRVAEPGGRESAKKAMRSLFVVLGDASPLTMEYRGKLSRALF